VGVSCGLPLFLYLRGQPWLTGSPEEEEAVPPAAPPAAAAPPPAKR